ncbi:MAG TPA: hypothetical protein DD381_05005 [Lentisphaeria bacterium]|nr:MAG: hypothetical protein A2X47_07665 [Lentisphaerae bacterium GWF2_38_69]HBM15689.1 hypothetical protein [Lentisphaeria bacterium]
MHKIECPNCHKDLSFDGEWKPEWIGQKTTCPSCNSSFEIQNPINNLQVKTDQPPSVSENDNSKSHKIFIVLFSLLVLLGVIAFGMIGYLVIPFAKDKAVWYQNAKHREDALTENLNNLSKAKQEYISKLDADINSNKSSLAAIQASINQLSDKQKRIDELNTNISSYETKINLLQSEYREIETAKTKDINASISALQLNENKLDTDIAKKQKQLDDLNTSYLAKKTSAEKDLNEFEANKKNLSNQIELAKQQLAGIANQIKESQAEKNETLIGLNNKIQEAQKQLDSLSNSINDANTNRTNATKENMDSQKKLRDSIDSLITSLDTDINKKKIEKSALTADIDSRHEALRSLETEKNRLMNNIEKLKKQESELNAKLNNNPTNTENKL